MKAWLWVSEWGHKLLPIAALFGVVKSIGVVGADEKYVQVPKNNKPDRDMLRWMYRAPPFWLPALRLILNK